MDHQEANREAISRAADTAAIAIDTAHRIAQAAGAKEPPEVLLAIAEEGRLAIERVRLAPPTEYATLLTPRVRT